LSARFGPDGRTIIYSANWDGAPFDLYTIQSQNAESREMGQPGTDLLSVSRSGDLAVSLRRRHKEGFTFVGTLARMPLGGGGPRELLDDVEYADWAPNGTDLAIVREVGGRTRLEYPISTVLYSTSGWISDVRISPQGDRVAFMDHPYQRDDAGQVKVVDRHGVATPLGPLWLSARGLAWSGEEIWFTGAKEGNTRALYAVNAAGNLRPLAGGPGLVMLCDVSRDGRALLTRDNDRLNLLVHAPGMTGERELSWLDWSRLRGISPDGRRVLFDETGQGGGGHEGVYIRAIDGSPAIRLGDGTAEGFSPDGKWVISLDVDRSRIVLLPTGAGEPRAIERGPLDRVHRAYWFPDGRRLLIAANETNHAARLYVQDLTGGAPHAVTPEGTSVEAVISPDGRFVAARSPDGQPTVFSIAGGAARPIPGVHANETMAQWTAEGGGVLVYDPVHVPVVVERVDLATGERRQVLEVAATNASPLYGLQYLFFTPDYSEYAYATLHQDSDVYLVEGLK
jgi:eukaryotic-like serine/threonine-protein kinase